jgi:hypothetical protein
LSTRSWGFKPSLLSGFITFVGGVHITSVLGLEGPESNLAMVDSPMKAEDALVVRDGSDPSDTLVVSVFSPSAPSLISGPLGLRSRNGLVSVPISEGEGVSSAGVPREQEGSKDLSLFSFQSVFRAVNMEGGVGDEGEGLGPLSVLPLAVELDKNSVSNVSPKWVMERVKGYYKLVGVSCDQFEDKLLALFEQIEAKRDQSLVDSLALVTSVSGVKGQREIKRLDCSINYEKKGEQSYRRRGKSKGVSCVNEA